MKIILDFDSKIIMLFVLLILASMLSLFFYSLAIANIKDDMYPFNAIIFSGVISLFFTNKKKFPEKSFKPIIVLSIILAILSYFNYWLNIPLVIFSIILLSYLLLRHFGIIVFKVFDFEAEQEKYF